MKPTTVYVIDDSPFDLLIASEMLQDHCAKKDIHCLEDAREALRQLQELKNTPEAAPDLIFLDIRMPNMDGFAFLEAYAALPETITKRSKLYMLSSSLDPCDIERAKANPFVIDFLEKPLEEDFLEKVFSTPIV